MPRRLIALLIALYAIAFAFGAMAAIRWPSLMMVAGFLLEEDQMAGLAGFDWRALGIAYGIPYFLAAVCFYAAALGVGNKRRISLAWYLTGCGLGFPCAFLVDFETGWWRDPSSAEGAVAGGALAAVLLAWAIAELCRKPRSLSQAVPAQADASPSEAPVQSAAQKSKPRKVPQRKPVPAAIARQRAAFAAEGRKMLARRRAYSH